MSEQLMSLRIQETFRPYPDRMNNQAELFYNDNSKQYSDSKILPFRFIETYNFLSLVKRIIEGTDQDTTSILLDVACGDGFYTRKIKELVGHSCKVIGVDISERMINLAFQMTDGALDIEYIRYDGTMLSDLNFREMLPAISNGFVDSVSGVFFLNYASSQSQLIKYLKSIYSILKPGGVFFGLNDNPNDDPSWYNRNQFKAIGFDKFIPSNSETKIRNEGDPVIYKIYNRNGSILEIQNYWISAEKFKESFEISGFIDFEWIDMKHIPKDVITKDSGLNDLYIEHEDQFHLLIDTAPVIFFKARKNS